MTTFRYENGTQLEVRLLIEPWAEEHIIQPGQKVKIDVQGGNAEQLLEFEQAPDGLIVHGYEGCEIKVSMKVDRTDSL